MQKKKINCEKILKVEKVNGLPITDNRVPVQAIYLYLYIYKNKKKCACVAFLGFNPAHDYSYILFVYEHFFFLFRNCLFFYDLRTGDEDGGGM